MKIPHAVIVRSPALLPMLYKPAELAEALSIPQRTLYDWFNAGAPHQRDGANHIWVSGQDFAKWVEETRPKKSARPKLTDNEAFCFGCKQAVSLTHSEIVPGKGRQYYIKGICPQCGHKIVRTGSKHDRAP
jgi:hypothetical protein